MASGVLSRFRGQLNASLTSLLKLGGEQRAQTGHCACCVYNIETKIDGIQDDQPSQTRSLLGSGREKRAAPSGGGNMSKLQADMSESQPPNGVATRSAEPTARANTDEFLSENGNSAAGGHLQTNFPTHHTMLKFIRSPTPTVMEGLDQPTSLTRLSSREADDEPENEPDAARPSSREHTMSELTSNNRLHASNQGNATMRALIRATKQEDDFNLADGQDESDPLVGTTLTATSGSLTNENASRAHSSVGSSPDQSGGTSQSTTNQARTLSNSSSRSSLALLANNRSEMSLQASGGRVMGVLSSVKSSAKRKLVGSKSVASPPAAMMMAPGGAPTKSQLCQLKRRASWQQNQPLADAQEFELTGRLATKPSPSDSNSSRTPIEVQLVDQNGNERKTTEAAARDQLWPRAPLLAASEIGPNSNEQDRLSVRASDEHITLATLSDDDADKPNSTNDTSSHSSSGASSNTTKGHDGIPSDHLPAGLTSAVPDHLNTNTTALMNFGPIGI